MVVNPDDYISEHFTYKEALYLPSWYRMASEIDGLNQTVLDNLKTLFEKLEQIRTHFKSPVIIHVAYRPEGYNRAIKGSLKSAHIEGKAVDFHIAKLDCDKARKEIIESGLLEKLNMRMERNDGSNWIHLDIREVTPGGNRYFYP